MGNILENNQLEGKDNEGNKNDTQNFNEKIYVWMDPQIYNDQNKIHYKNLFSEKNIDCKRYNNVEEGFDFLIKKENNFKEIVIIISGKYFNDFYHRIKKNITSIKFSPTIIVFTGAAKFFINQLKMNNIYYNNDLFDKKLIFNRALQLEDYIENKNTEGKDLTFDLIVNLDQLIIPTYFSYLLDDVKRPEIDCFNNFLQKTFLPPSEEEIKNLTTQNSEDSEVLSLKLGNKKIPKLLNQIKDKKAPKEIIIKYWLKIYCLQSEFYCQQNKSLRSADNQVNYYYPFIKLCYEGIKKGFLKSYNKEIYRCSKITKKEFIEIQKYFHKTHKKNNFPSIIVFSRSFLSLSADEKQARKFRGANETTFSIMYIFQEIKNIDIFENKVFNANLDDYSDYNEKDVLVFPFSCFEIVDIKEIKEDKIDYQIKLKYLGNYSNDIKKQFGTNFFDKIQVSDFSEGLIESGLVKIHDFFATWVKKNDILIKLDKICFFLEGKEDLVSFANKNIYVFNLISFQEKLTITIHDDQIVDIIKLKYNRICSYSKDGMIYIHQFSENHEKVRIINKIVLYENYAKDIIFSKNYFLCLNNNKYFMFYELKENKYNYEKNIKEEGEILIMKKVNHDKVVYISENKLNKKFINFIDLNKGQKEKNIIKIKEEKEPKLKVIDLICFNDYVIIGYDHRIDFFNYQERNGKIQSLEYFDFEIINIIIFSSNRMILGFYDSSQNKSFIREHLLRVEDLQNNLNKFDYIGQGKLECNQIENILKINDSKILINIKNHSCMIYERKNEASEILKEILWANNSNQITIQKKPIKINIDNVQKSETFEKRLNSARNQQSLFTPRQSEVNNSIKNYNNQHEVDNPNKNNYNQKLK